ncbi:hypothetical protein [Labilibaculum filiforme]|nr:hypothetical protein [Labilibaculum filiforme]
MAKEEIHQTSINLTELDVFLIPKMESKFVEKYELIKLDCTEKYSVQSFDEADCKFIYFHEWKNINLLVVVYFPSRAGAGSPKIQLTTITNDGEVVDRKLISYLYFIDPGSEPTQIFKIIDENKFELITREIKRELIDDEFVFSSDKTKKEVFIIRNGIIEKLS